MSRRKPKPLILDADTSGMARKVGELLDLQPGEAVRFCLILFTVNYAVDPAAIAKLRANLKTLGKNT